MTGNPTKQSFYIGIESIIPASILSKDDAVNFLNSPGSQFWNDVLQSVYDISYFVGKGLPVTSVSFSDSKWIDYNSKATLTTYMNVVSDPLSTEQVSESLLVGLGLLAVAIGAALLLIPVGGWAVDLVGIILSLAGVLTLSLAFVQEVGVVLPSPSTLGGILFYGSIIATAAVGTGLILYAIKKH